IGTAALARIHTDRRIASAHRLRSRTRRWLAGPLHVGERIADVVQDRILHRELKMLTLTRALPPDIGAENGDRHQHAGASVADGRAWLARRTVFFAGDAHEPAGRLRDH